jgi:hypothetical protein
MQLSEEKIGNQTGTEIAKLRALSEIRGIRRTVKRAAVI